MSENMRRLQFKYWLVAGVLLVIFVYSAWVAGPTPSKEQVVIRQTQFRPNKPKTVLKARYNPSAVLRYVPKDDIRHDKWIVVTSIASPTEDVKFMANVPGWKVVVVGDTKTPSDWSYPNCVFLSVEDQESLGFRTVPHLPTKSYSRKNVGYLYAISHGAQIIYETDDDNRPLDLLKNFITTPTTHGLMYRGVKTFNPYRHFGQPNLWPRGYPLSYVGENETFKYELDEWRTPAVQQGVVNGDPDMDAIFRLTQKKTTVMLNVTFDGRAPPGIVPRGVLTPYNSQNTLFLYEALWSLYIPSSVTFRVCDIWRGYWTQRLMWELGLNLAFFPPNAFQKRNAHNYLSDFREEDYLYGKTEDLIDFLLAWSCPETRSFFECIIILSDDMAQRTFWENEDADTIRDWIADLKSFGYTEPKRVPFEVNIPGERAEKDSSPTHVNYWPAVQAPPLKVSNWKGDHAVLKHIDQVTTLCPMMKVTTDLSVLKDFKTFPNILLVIVYEKAESYDSIKLMESMYSAHFPHIVHCGNSMQFFQFIARDLKYPVTFTEVTGKANQLVSKCLLKASKMGYFVDGFLHMRSGILLNVQELSQMSQKKIWFAKSKLSANVNADDNGFDTSSSLMSRISSSVSRGVADRLQKNIQRDKSVFQSEFNVVYLPAKYQSDFEDIVTQLSSNIMSTGQLISLSLGGIQSLPNAEILKGAPQGKDILASSKYDFYYPDTTQSASKGLVRSFYCHKVAQFSFYKSDNNSQY